MRPLGWIDTNYVCFLKGCFFVSFIFLPKITMKCLILRERVIKKAVEKMNKVKEMISKS